MQANPETICVFLSGTLTNKSIGDYEHTALLSLRHTTPVPTEEADLEIWKSLVDVGGMPTANARRALKPLLDWHSHTAGTPAVPAHRIDPQRRGPRTSTGSEASPGSWARTTPRASQVS